MSRQLVAAGSAKTCPGSSPCALQIYNRFRRRWSRDGAIEFRTVVTCGSKRCFSYQSRLTARRRSPSRRCRLVSGRNCDAIRQSCRRFGLTRASQCNSKRNAAEAGIAIELPDGSIHPDASMICLASIVSIVRNCRHPIPSSHHSRPAMPLGSNPPISARRIRRCRKVDAVGTICNSVLVLASTEGLVPGFVAAVAPPGGTTRSG